MQQTPLPIIARVSSIVTRVVDRIAGDRVDCPLLVGVACAEALKLFGIEARVMYGQVAWVEIMEDQTPVWAGCWGDNYHFWVTTQYGEVVDLNTSVAFRKRSHVAPQMQAIYSPPILWSREVPAFYRYIPEGIAELDLKDERDVNHFELVISEIREKCDPTQIDVNTTENLEFPNEPILCPGRKVLDDSKESFKHFDRAIAVAGLPEAPI